ncbi:hypothetical protein [Aeoliella sp.]|uniref:hypothetical protein n=1 Tax=Aeoliella sp. TaxID=2795800 RepID=UPI003CCB854C
MVSVAAADLNVVTAITTPANSAARGIRGTLPAPFALGQGGALAAVSWLLLFGVIFGINSVDQTGA